MLRKLSNWLYERDFLSYNSFILPLPLCMNCKTRIAHNVSVLNEWYELTPSERESMYLSALVECGDCYD